MSKKVKLKPCPFCGEQPSILKNMGTVFCGNDACFGPQTTAERLEDSAVQWNARASSPAQEPVTTEPVAWRWKVHGIWHYAGGFPVSGAEPLYALPAPPQPGRAWLPIVGMEWPTEPVLLGFWYHGEFKKYIGTHAPEGWVAAWMESPSQYFPDHMQAWFTHWRPLPAPPAGEPE